MHVPPGAIDSILVPPGFEASLAAADPRRNLIARLRQGGSRELPVLLEMNARYGVTLRDLPLEVVQLILDNAYERARLILESWARSIAENAALAAQAALQKAIARVEDNASVAARRAMATSLEGAGETAAKRMQDGLVVPQGVVTPQRRS